MKKTLSVALGASLVISVLIPASSQASAASINGSCRKAGLKAGTNKKPLVCKKVGKKLMWKAAPAPSKAPATPKETVSQSNARKKGASYLKYSAFSRSGLIEQLEFEGFSNADATYGADAQKANWNAQAVTKGASYLKTSSFSRSGLVNQLVFEGFTDVEAEFGVAGNKADWNAQAAKKAASYLKTSAFSRQGLLDQLLFEGFTDAEANFGVASTGL